MHVVVGVTGGIAAYKATAIIRGLTEAGHSVKVIPTQNALRFIGATTLEALSHNAVDADLYTDVASVKHVHLGQQADLVIVAPASASFLARFASGIADDLLTNTLLVTKAPILVAPAMHTEMWQNPATIQNVKTLRSRSITVLEPATGRLTGDDSGPGRLPEADEILAAALALKQTPDLAGRRVLISAGGTQEPIDPVRYIGNRSSGKQGIALAIAAKARGAKVSLLAANVADAPKFLDELVEVSTASELAAAVSERLAQTDVLIMAAAVSDYRVEEVADLKIKKNHLQPRIELNLVENEDILANACQKISSETLSCLAVGFAAETTSSTAELQEIAVEKLKRKGCDLIVANDVSRGAVFGSFDNAVLIIDKDGSVTSVAGLKSQVANAILDRIAQLQK